MRHLIVLCVVLTAACGAKASCPATAPVSPATAKGLDINLATLYVDDQDKALRFYTEVVGFTKQDDFSNSGYRWLTVTDGDGTQLLLSKNDNPAAKAYQQAQFQASQPAAMFFTSDVKADYERLKAAGAEFTMPPTEVMAGSKIATFKDTCGNLIQITQLAH